MMMTEVEIAEDYRKSGFSMERVKALAEINDCTVSEIKEIIENQGANSPEPEIRKPGRPKKKVEVPKSILQFANTRITQLTEVISSTREDLARMENELEELTKYMDNVTETE